MTEALEPWKDFNVAMAGATGALAGLAIVAASVNIGDIVKDNSLTARLASGVVTLVLALIASAVGLVPDLPLTGYGIAVLVSTLVAVAFHVVASRQIFLNKDPKNRLPAVKAGVGFVPLVSYVAGATLLLTDNASGLTYVAIASILAIISALLVSWVVLVEVLR
jgi:hypothetical protein